jgi:hypothetical protein
VSVFLFPTKMKVLFSIICLAFISLATSLPGLKKAKRNTKLNLLLDSIAEAEIEDDLFTKTLPRKAPSYVALAAASELHKENSPGTSRWKPEVERKSISYVHQSILKPNRWTAETLSPIAVRKSAGNAVPPRSSKTRWDSNGDSEQDICENICSTSSTNALKPVKGIEDSFSDDVSSFALSYSKDKTGIIMKQVASETKDHSKASTPVIRKARVGKSRRCGGELSVSPPESPCEPLNRW